MGRETMPVCVDRGGETAVISRRAVENNPIRNRVDKRVEGLAFAGKALT